MIVDPGEGRGGGRQGRGAGRRGASMEGSLGSWVVPAGKPCNYSAEHRCVMYYRLIFFFVDPVHNKQLNIIRIIKKEANKKKYTELSFDVFRQVHKMRPYNVFVATRPPEVSVNAMTL